MGNRTGMIGGGLMQLVAYGAQDVYLGGHIIFDDTSIIDQKEETKKVLILLISKKIKVFKQLKIISKLNLPKDIVYDIIYHLGR